MYKYEEQRPNIFTESGLKILLEMKEKIESALDKSGAFRLDKVMTTGDSWTMLAVVDYLVEIGEIREIRQEHCAAQHRVFVAKYK